MLRRVLTPGVNAVQAASIKTLKPPLRILFCGSDSFSCESLRALHKEKERNPSSILSIDVLCRPGKPSGRSLKVIKEPPIKQVAISLGLPVHERDTFTGWNLPNYDETPINLIVAVSFGLFVPPRILQSADYGGLNVHPSLLPRHRGPAPIQHTILNGDHVTGVTLQTLDDKAFDHGVILDRTPGKSLVICDKTTTYSDLLQRLTPLAAEILARGIRNYRFLPHLRPLELTPTSKSKGKHRAPSHAPKITSNDKEINWSSDDAKTISRKFRALGPLWSILYKDDETPVRVKFERLRLIKQQPEVLDKWYEVYGTGQTQPIQPKQPKQPTPLTNNSSVASVPGESNDTGPSEPQWIPPSELKDVHFLVYKHPDGRKVPLPYYRDIIKQGRNEGGIIISLGKQAVKVFEMKVEGGKTGDAGKVADRLQGDGKWELLP